LGPSERAIVEVQFAESGTYALEHRTPNDTYALGSVTVEGPPADAATVAAFGKLRANGQAAADIEPFRKHFGKPVDKRISLTVEMRGMTGMGGHHMPDGTYMEGMRMGTPSADGIEWEDDGMAMMNAMARDGAVQWHIRDQDTGKQDMDIAWTFARGEAVKIRITNDGTSMHPMQHPFHLHGQRFLVLDRNGTPNDNLVWKDTVMVPAGQYVDILLDASNPGTWMAHCHIAEHLEAGMMMEFTVE
jgi:FtsP/CotA-like multicopper oxidase with cupredoxin domain